MFRTPIPALVTAAFALSACLPVIQVIDRPVGTTGADTASAAEIATLPPADFVSVRLLDGSPGLALWCDVRSDCIGAARVLCDNRHSIRAEFDIDPNSPGAAQYFSQSRNSPVQMTVSCPV